MFVPAKRRKSWKASATRVVGLAAASSAVAVQLLGNGLQLEAQRDERTFVQVEAVGNWPFTIASCWAQTTALTAADFHEVFNGRGIELIKMDNGAVTGSGGLPTDLDWGGVRDCYGAHEEAAAIGDWYGHTPTPDIHSGQWLLKVTPSAGPTRAY